MFVCCEFCVLSRRGLCDELTTRPEEAYRLWCVISCYLETSTTRRVWPTGGCRARHKQTRSCSGSSCYKPAPYCRGLISVPGQFMWDLLWTKWLWYMLLPEH